VEVFSRVTGFFRPVQDWNRGKAEEFGDRKTYTVARGFGRLIGEKPNSFSPEGCAEIERGD